MMKFAKQSIIFSLRHCEECSGRVVLVNQVKGLLKINERRSNLTSLIGCKELFNIFRKITSARTQSREIAARMQQSQLNSFFSQYIQRLAMMNGVEEARFL
jgi:hypothetical protein